MSLKNQTRFAFTDRTEAGLRLASQLRDYNHDPHALVMAVPRGGVPVGAAIARELHLPLTLIPCKKMVHPAFPDQTIGSVCEDHVVVHPDWEIPTSVIQHQVSRLRRHIEEKKDFYGTRHYPVKNNTVILTDDRLKNPDTLLACIQSLKSKNPAEIIVAVPVISQKEMDWLMQQEIRIVSLLQLPELKATETYYEFFPQLTDAYVKEQIEQYTRRR